MLVQAPAPLVAPTDEKKDKDSPEQSTANASASRWPYGLLVGAMAFGALIMLGGLILQETFAPGLWTARESWIPAHPDGPRSQPAPVYVSGRSVDDLKRSFARIGYALPSDGAARVPRLKVAGLPDDLTDISDAKERKALFLQTVLPMVLTVNEDIRLARREVMALAKQVASEDGLEDEDLEWLSDLQRLFGIKQKGEAPAPRALLKRIDEVPVALALAQAAIESGWGTSRFALEGNALFGQRTWKKGDGLVPEARGDGESFRVRSFSSPVESVWAYIHNLNTSPAYGNWRARRAQLRAAGKSLNATALLAGLEAYSEKGAEYLAALDAMIRKEKLGRFQKARLASPLVDNESD